MRQLPVRGRAVLVVALQRLRVVHAFVAEHRAAFGDLAAVAHQRVPVEMPHLVAEVPEQRAVGLAELVPPPLALGRIGLGKVDGDEAVVMAGQHRLLLGGVGKDVERQPGPARRRERQPEAQERIDEAPLGGLGLAEQGARFSGMSRSGMRRPSAQATHSVGAPTGVSQLQLAGTALTQRWTGAAPSTSGS